MGTTNSTPTQHAREEQHDPTGPTAGMAGLEHALGRPAPEAFAGLGAADAEHLAAAVRTAQARQTAQLEGAVTEALTHVPRPLRGAVRKAVGL